MLVLAASLSGQAASAQGGATPVWPTQQWQTSTPEEQGMESAALAGLLDFGATRSLDSLLLVRHGRIVLDAYYAPYTAEIPHRINSATKAVIGTLLAIAQKDGLLDRFDHPVLDFFADRNVANLDDRKKAITVQNLLDMTSGINWQEPLEGRPDSMIEMSRQQDWTKFALDRPMASAPGEIFNYNSGGTHILSALITKLTGMSASDYAKAKLFGPLGISVSNWWRDPQGISIGGFGLALLPRDMAKIGYLYLRGGQWEDNALLLPADHGLAPAGHRRRDDGEGLLPARQTGGFDCRRGQIGNGIAGGRRRIKSAREQDSRHIDREGDRAWRDVGDCVFHFREDVQISGQWARREIIVAESCRSKPAL
jgi:CubicO group peptidase (beta-lactamase class C family)